MKKILSLIAMITLSITLYSNENNNAGVTKTINNEDNNSLVDSVVFNQQTSEILNAEDLSTIQFLQPHNLEQYGGKFSIGIAIGGGGTFGVPVRSYLSPKLALELGLFYRPAIVLNSDESFNSIMLAGGVNYYFSKFYKEKKEKVKMNGIMFKAGQGFGNFNTTMVGGGWIHESFKETNSKRSFTFELGPGLLVTSNFPAGYYDYNKSAFAIYWKLTWSWYTK